MPRFEAYSTSFQVDDIIKQKQIGAGGIIGDSNANPSWDKTPSTFIKNAITIPSIASLPNSLYNYATNINNNCRNTMLPSPIETIRAPHTPDVFICVLDLLNDNFCLSSGDGDILGQSIESHLRDGRDVHISFRDVSEISSAFLESIIRRLHKSGISEEEIENGLTLCDLSDDDRFIFRRTVDRVKDFLKAPDRFEASMNEVLGEVDD